MVVPIRNIRNKFSSNSAFNNCNSNIALVIDDIDMIDDCVVSNIIYEDSDSNNEVRGCTLVSSITSSYSVLCFSSNKSVELYMNWMQRESNSMVQDKPTTLANSIQLEYVTQEAQNPIVSKVADISSNTRTVHRHNVAPTHVNSTVVNNCDIINVQLNYDINQPLDPNS